MINVKRSNPVSCILTTRVGQKREDLETGEEPVSKCARLSESPGDSGLLGSSPGSLLSPVPSSGPTHQGPSRIGPFLLLHMADRDRMHSALNIDTGDALVCKVSPKTINIHCAISLNE